MDDVFKKPIVDLYNKKKKHATIVFVHESSRDATETILFISKNNLI